MKVILDRKDIEEAIAAEMLRKFPGYTIKLQRLQNITGEIEVVLTEPSVFDRATGQTDGR